MSSVIRPPDPCLVAIALVASSRAGAKFIFHYPPIPTLATSIPKRKTETLANQWGSDSNASTDEEESSSDDDTDDDFFNSLRDDEIEPPPLSLGSPRPTDRMVRRPSSSSQSTRTSNRDRESQGSIDLEIPPEGPRESPREERRGKRAERPVLPPWETFLGMHTEVWQKLLAPGPSWHKRRFEVGVNDLTFVGWPVFVREDGTWRKKKKRNQGTLEDGVFDIASFDSEQAGYLGAGASYRAPSSDGRLIDEELFNPSPIDGNPEDDEKAVVEGMKDPMTMFNVVFVMDPPILEHNARVRENYDNVIKKLGKGLKSEQATDNYIWEESKKIVRMKEKAKRNKTSLTVLYDELLAKSSLAQAIATIFRSISTSKIASFTLTPHTTMSLQIPPLTSTSHLPGPTESEYPGLWLTTADSLSAGDDATDEAEYSGPSKLLAKHFALLLLSDEASILKDIENSMGSLGPPLAHYIRSSKPTKSFAQISLRSSIPLSDIQVLATHLIYWRRARAVPPLNKQDTYIVSPNCDMSKLAMAAAAYEVAFPTMPSLPKMLAILSGPPRPYGSFIPSRDHKEKYYEILAWLMRGGWVTQLRSFGWVKVTPDVKRATADVTAKEVTKGTEGDTKGKEDDLASSVTTVIRAGEQNLDKTASSTHHSPDNDKAASTTGEQSAHQQGNNKPRPPLVKSSLILRPHRASPMESRWLDEIISRFPDEDIPERPYDMEEFENVVSLHRFWNSFTKYFNGVDALEKIPVREGLNRKLVWRLLNRIDARTSLDGDDVERVLVTVRHW